MRNPFRKRWEIVSRYAAMGDVPFRDGAGRFWLRSSAALRVAELESYRWAFPPGLLHIRRLP